MALFRESLSQLYPKGFLKFKYFDFKRKCFSKEKKIKK